MAAITEEVADLEQQQSWEKLFIEIKKSSQYESTCKAAKLPGNRHKNRYGDVSPYDHSRVKLQRGTSDYINSSHVKVSEAGRHYILSQGPLPSTSGHLWQMVWEQNSKAVIMLNRIVEKGMRKCDQYWPVDKNYPLAFYDDGYMITLINETDMQNFVIRELELLRIKDNKARSVYHFHYTAWPDFDVPKSPASFLNFLACIRRKGVLDNHNGPAVIHCSAGIGRSGTFILIDTCLELLEKGISFEIHRILLEMRKYRMGLIQTPQQLRFSYFAIAECERIILFKQSDEENNGYSDADILSDAESEDYDQLCRDNHITYDNADEENDIIEPTPNPARVLSENNDPDATSSAFVEFPLTECSQAEAESVSSIEDVESSETIKQPQTDSSNTNSPHKTETLTKHDSGMDKRRYSSDTENDQEASWKIKFSKKPDSFENVRSSVNKKCKDEEDNKEPTDLRTLENNDQTKQAKLDVPLTLTDAEITESSDSFKQRDASITTLVSPENDVLRKRVFESNEISDADSTTKSHKPHDIVNNSNGEKSWRPYIIGGLVVSAFGALITFYSRL